MNKIKYILIALIAIVATSCTQDRMFEEITSVPLKRCLEPMNLSARVDANSGVATTFRWDVTSDAEEYLLEVLDAETNEVVISETLAPGQVPFVTELEADGKYTFRVTAKSSKLQDSKLAAYDDTFKTYAIKDNLFLNVTGKSADAITVAWSNEVADFTDVTHIEVTPTAGGKAKTFNLTDGDADAAAATLNGLDSSTEYDIVLFFKSASRGAVTAWTSPNPGDLVPVSTTEALIAAMTAGEDVYVSAAGSPYAVGSVTPAKGFRMLGEFAADGSRPVVAADIVLDAGFTGDLYFENIHFDGTGRDRIVNHKASALNIDKISFVNCEITDYNCGIFYSNSNDKLTMGEFLIEGCDIYNIKGSGGDGFDVRVTTEIGKITFRNNTVYNGFRSFFRVDDKDNAVTLGEFLMENNTIKGVATNDKGLLYIRCPWTKITARKNLFLHQIGEKAVLATTNKVENVPTDITAADNYCYNIGEKFFGETKNFTAEQMSATVLTADPCFNSKGNNFYLANADLQEKKIGAAKWWNSYVEPVEDLTQGFTTAPHNWDLGDATLFAGDLEKSKVRDELLMVGSEARKMNLDGAITFTATADVNKKGVPTDGYIAFKVTGPGSIIIKVEDPEAVSSQIVIATGDVDGAAATVKGGVSANPQGEAQKIILADIAEETMVYLYPTGSAKITALSWTPDMAGVNTALAAPKATIDVNKVTEGDETPLTVTWNEVENAASYTVTFNKKKTTLKEFSFEIPAETVMALEPGVYTVTVVANPADTDPYNTVSEEASVAFAVMAKAADPTPEPEVKTIVWDFTEEYSADFNVADTKTYKYDAGSVAEVAAADETEVLYFSPNGKAIKYAGKTSTADSKAYKPITYGGGAAYAFFRTDKAGTLKVTATQGKTAADNSNCKLGVRIGDAIVGEDVDLGPYDTSKEALDAQTFEWTIENTSGNVQEIRIIKPSGATSPWIYRIEFIYTEGAATEPEPEVYKWNFTQEYSADFNVADTKTYKYDAGAVTEVAAADETEVLYFSPNGKAIKYAGKTSTADNVAYKPITYGGGAAYAFFRTAKKGTLKVTATQGKTAADNSNCKLGVRIGDSVVGEDVDLGPYDTSKEVLDAQTFEWTIENTSGNVQEIKIMKPSGATSPWIYEIEFIAQ